jgi:UDP-N-acetylmuramoylalanine-D-glutamate ligase
MNIADVQDKRICIIGFGKEGQAMCAYLEKHAVTPHITIADARPIDTAYPSQIGVDMFAHLDRFDVLIVSPGVVPCAELDAYPGVITTMNDVFVDSAKHAGATVIGVTGSKGKSTVTSLVYALAKTLDIPVYIAGNIGVPSIELLEHAAPNTIFVVELSSYQLGRMQVSPQIAVVTSFFPDHLDYYLESQSVRSVQNETERDMQALQEYKQAKMHITKFQTTADIVFYDTYTSGACDIAAVSAGTKIATSAVDALVSIADTKLIGEHNLRNIALATKVAQFIGVPNEQIIAVSKSFTGLRHRLEHIGIVGGIEWIDDAISTTQNLLSQP